METNATLLTDSIVQAIKAAKMFVAVSLDGPDRESHEWLRGVPGSWDMAMKGLSLLRENGIPFQVICCLHRGNIHKLHLMPKLVKKLGGTSLKVNPITGIGRSSLMKDNNELISLSELLDFYNGELQAILEESEIKIFFDIPPAFKTLKEIAKHRIGVCGILTILGVLYDGSTGLCGIGEKVSELNFGQPGKDGMTLQKVWEENPLLNKIRNNIPFNLAGICGRCKMKYYCLGKCLAQTFVVSGDILRGFPFCEEAFRIGKFPKSRLIK